MEAVEIQRLREKVAFLEAEVAHLKGKYEGQDKVYDVNSVKPRVKADQILSNIEISRYGRQLIIPEIGIEGQKKLKRASVLVVGAGGLGAPVALYLASCGIGRLGIIDYDEVELGNLHRQIIHDETKIKVPKVLSAVQTLEKLNSDCIYEPYQLSLDSSNAMNIIKKYDVVVDATDNVATRYLLNDCCVLSHKVLVSGSALRLEGQLTVYNYENGPCYRCLFPIPPPPETVTNCSNGGVLGVVPGIIGTLQALEVIKIVVGLQPSYAQKLLLFDALSGTFRVVKLRGRNKNCQLDGENPTIIQPIDYVQFCGSAPDDKTINEKRLSPEERITCVEYKKIVKNGEDHVLLDVREKVQFEICSLPHSLHIPLNQLEPHMEEIYQKKLPVYVVCRRGNDSQIAVEQLKKKYGDILAKDIVGGLQQWTLTVDPDFPLY